MKQAVFTRLISIGVVVAAAMGGACTMKSQDAPPLSGPSELGTSITITAAPDVLTLDGASQSLITVTARDPNGAPLRSVSMRTEIAVGGIRADYGTLSARNIVTDTAGRATLIYTAPTIGNGYAVDNGTVVDILVTPVGTDFGNALTRNAAIRLVPPGIVVPPDGLAPYFTFSPTAPTDNQSVLFEACGDPQRPCAPSNNPVASYTWDFGDGRTGSGRLATHSYSASGSFVATLKITDAIGRSASTAQTVNVGQGALPTVAFTFSPSAPQIGQVVNFNASATRPGPGRTIQSYFWDFGDGDQKTTTTALTTHDFLAAGSYTVTLVVTDDAGRTSSGTVSVSVTSDAPTADFTFSPASPTVGVNVNFNSGTSVPAPGRTIASYLWNFGDGATSTAATPSHAFAAVGDYNVVLVVTDSAGKTGRVTKTVSVK
jgi:PKD repeat protein